MRRLTLSASRGGVPIGDEGVEIAVHEPYRAAEADRSDKPVADHPPDVHLTHR